MIEVDFSSETATPFSGSQISRLVDNTSKMVKTIKGRVEINVIGDKEIRKINKLYRGIDKPTDVLSFAWQEEGKDKDFLGQIFISYPRIKKQAKENSVPTEEEFVRMMVHGLLHLVGYDHIEEKDEEKMFALQERIIKKIL